MVYGKPAKLSSKRNRLLRSNTRKLGVRGWSKQKAKEKVKGIQSLVAIDKCLTR
jgi:hypothetical protein